MEPKNLGSRGCLIAKSVHSISPTHNQYVDIMNTSDTTVIIEKDEIIGYVHTCVVTDALSRDTTFRNPPI
jgi:hypothetical protein